MPSPFPGMDPYLEGPLWPDVHSSLLYVIRAQLSSKLPPGFTASLDQYVWMTREDEDTGPRRTRRGKPDVFVTGGRSGAATLCSAPTGRVPLPRSTPRPHRAIHLYDEGGTQLVTVIELLSPAEKKSGSDRRNYLAKRAEYLAADVNLLEIDLIRRGRRVPFAADPPADDYLVSLIRGGGAAEADLWAFSVRDRMPVVPVPLTEGVADVPLDLRAALDRAYDEAPYGPKVDYRQPPKHPLRTADASWSAALLAGLGAADA